MLCECAGRSRVKFARRRRAGASARTSSRVLPNRDESFADWKVRIDAGVDSAARSVEKLPPLLPAQGRIVQMLVDHLNSLPLLAAGENAFWKKSYSYVNQILTTLFLEKYPEWEDRRLTSRGTYDVEMIPADGELLVWLMRNCAGGAPREMFRGRADEDDDD
jgi:hypothetical protein